jgi:histidinol phosphatase-like enzyme (inositol monophosphatase family)
MSHPLTRNELKKALTVARQAAVAGGKHALRYFRTDLKVIRKVDRSPVTRADRESEKVIRGILERAFPGHLLCGEEYGWDRKTSALFKWWIDPVDGTRQFIRGIPLWGTLVALEADGEVVVGVIYHPVLDLCIWASKGLGCYANGRPAHVSRISGLRNGTLTYGGLRLFKPAASRKILRATAHCYDDRGYGDCYAHTLVILGQAEAMVDPIVKPYDVAAVKICVEEAGGMFTDLKGRPSIYSGNALSSNGNVHQRLLKSFR